MIEILLALVAVLLVALVGVGIWRGRGASTAALQPRLDLLQQAHERTERSVREEIGRHREETRGIHKELREEIAASIQSFNDSVIKQLVSLTESNEGRLNQLRGTLDTRLLEIQEQSGKKLDEMRRTVDEKLQDTLEKRLSESFKQVSERLEAVHKGLGEMQVLAAGVGDLKKVLSNVKARGTWGEIQLGSLLEQVLSPGQYETNVATRRGRPERVEYAIKLPGPEEGEDEVVWLPIDAKFPLEDYQRLLQAQDQADVAASEEAGRALEARVKASAREIRDKYIHPPETTDFALLFLPIEGLYAEVLRRPGLADTLQREYRVVPSGPTTLAAILNSLQMGFRTLAIQKRSGEVWKLLGAVKQQFGKFSGILENVHAKLQQASTSIEDATRKSRFIESRLRKVEELPESDAAALLPALSDPVDDEDDLGGDDDG